MRLVDADELLKRSLKWTAELRLTVSVQWEKEIMRLIDVDELKIYKFESYLSPYDIGFNAGIKAVIESVPTIDPVNHAHWESEYGTHYCSKCKNYIAHEPTFYCPNCGAKMDEIVDGYKYDFKTQTYVYIQSP